MKYIKTQIICKSCGCGYKKIMIDNDGSVIIIKSFIKIKGYCEECK